MKSLAKCRIVVLLGVLAALVTIGSNSQAYGTSVSIDLKDPLVTPATATFDLFATFPGNPGDQIEAMTLSVVGSSSQLTDNGTDFSRFSFQMDPTTLAGWMELLPLSMGRGFYAPFDPVNGPFIQPSPDSQHLGQVVVDLVGLPGQTGYLVTVADDSPDLGTDMAGMIGGELVLSIRNSQDNQFLFAQPEGVPFESQAVIPEPVTLVTGIISLAAIGIQTLRRRRVSSLLS